MVKKEKYIKLWPDADTPRKKKELKLNHKQRVERGFGYIDGWSFDTYLAQVISNYAKWYIVHSPGYWHDTPEETEKVLKIIHKGFKNYSEQHFEKSPEDIKHWLEAKELFFKHFSNLWT